MLEEDSIFDLPRERLDLIDHDVYKWICMVDGCTNGTYIRDYGESPLYFHPRHSIKWFDARERRWLCSKHWPQFKKRVTLLSKFNPLAIDNLVFVKSVTVTNLKLHE